MFQELEFILYIYINSIGSFDHQFDPFINIALKCEKKNHLSFF